MCPLCELRTTFLQGTLSFINSEGSPHCLRFTSFPSQWLCTHPTLEFSNQLPHHCMGTNSITATWNEIIQRKCVWTKVCPAGYFSDVQPGHPWLEGVASFQGNLIFRGGFSGLIWPPLAVWGPQICCSIGRNLHCTFMSYILKRRFKSLSFS